MKLLTCDGEGPHNGEPRPYPLSKDARAFLCRTCWAKENIFREREMDCVHLCDCVD